MWHVRQSNYKEKAMPTAGTPQNTAAKTTTAPKKPFNPKPLMWLGLFAFIVFMWFFGVRLSGILHPDAAKCTDFAYNVVQKIDMPALKFKWPEKTPLFGGSDLNIFNEPGVNGKWLGACKSAPVPFNDEILLSLVGVGLNLGIWIMSCLLGRGGFWPKRWLGLIGLIVAIGIMLPHGVVTALAEKAFAVRLLYLCFVLPLANMYIMFKVLERRPIVVTSSTPKS